MVVKDQKSLTHKGVHRPWREQVNTASGSVAFILTHFWPGATEEQYWAEVAAVHPEGGLPEGQIYHAAGSTEGGVLIVATWDSKESSDRFVAEVLMPHVPEPGGFSGRPEERSAESFNVLMQ